MVFKLTPGIFHISPLYVRITLTGRLEGRCYSRELLCGPYHSLESLFTLGVPDVCKSHNRRAFLARYRRTRRIRSSASLFDKYLRLASVRRPYQRCFSRTESVASGPSLEQHYDKQTPTCVHSSSAPLRNTEQHSATRECVYRTLLRRIETSQLMGACNSGTSRPASARNQLLPRRQVLSSPRPSVCPQYTASFDSSKGVKGNFYPFLERLTAEPAYAFLLPLHCYLLAQSLRWHVFVLLDDERVTYSCCRGSIRHKKIEHSLTRMHAKCFSDGDW